MRKLQRGIQKELAEGVVQCLRPDGFKAGLFVGPESVSDSRTAHGRLIVVNADRWVIDSGLHV
jgi:hypothetical protein